jgi:L-lactate dehydrogenase (cytochrome)
MQLYVDRNRSKSEKLLEVISDLGMKAIFVTVDAHAPGKREADERSRAEIEVVRRIGFLRYFYLSPELLVPLHIIIQMNALTRSPRA